MANQFSDHYASTTYGLALSSPAPKVPWHLQNRHQKVARILLGLASGGTPAAFTIADVARMMTFKSSDRISELKVAAAGGTAVAADLGIYLAGTAHDGAVVDADEFASALSLAGTVTYADVFAESVAAETIRRGMPLWERLGLTSDPGVEYDLCFLATATLTTADAAVIVIANGAFS